MRLALLIAVLAAPAAAQDPTTPPTAPVVAPVPVPVPSGQAITFLDVIHDAPGAAGLTVRFRFLAPGIAPDGGVDFETAVADMAHLCETYALPRIAVTGPIPAQIIISLSDSPVPFGEATPEVTQFFEAYSIEGGLCIWEAF